MNEGSVLMMCICTCMYSTCPSHRRMCGDVMLECHGRDVMLAGFGIQNVTRIHQVQVWELHVHELSVRGCRTTLQTISAVQYKALHSKMKSTKVQTLGTI